MRPFLGALGFLTTLPLGRKASFSPQDMAQYFPLVGIVLGIVLFLADAAFSHLWSDPVAAWLVVAVLILLTGALHLDGLADAADGLFSHRSADRILQIMKDTRIGVMGLVAVVVVLFAKWGGIMDLGQDKWIVLILVPAYARAGLLVAMRLLPYGRPEEGIGRDFFRDRQGWKNFWGFGVLLPASLLLGGKALVLIGAFLLITFLALWFCHRRIGCVTGDTLGALVEILEAGLFLALAAV